MKHLLTLLRAISVRAFEPSTYAGLGVFGMAAAHSLGLDTASGRMAFAASMVTSLIAIAKKEGTPWLNKLLVGLEKGVATGAEVAPALAMIRHIMATQKGVPPELVKALDEVIKGISAAEQIEKTVKAPTQV